MDSNAFSHSSYPDSGNSSPRSRDVDLETSSWDEPLPNSYRVRFMCSYGGKIQPRSHDNQLAYVGGDTKILAVDRGIKFSSLVSKLSSLCGGGGEACFKYQLPGEDLDALISVTNDEDLEHMMLEYDRLCRASVKPARLRLFMFPMSDSAPTSFAESEGKPGSQWFVDALNSVQMRGLEGSSPTESTAAVAALNPDFLFGLEKGFPARKLQDPPAALDRDVTAGSDCGSEDRQVISEPVISQAEIHRQIQELRRMQIAGHEQVHLLNRKVDDAIVNPRASTGDYYGHRPPEKVASPAPAPAPAPAPPPAPVAVPVPMQIPASFQSERHMTSGSYPMGGAGNEQPVYYIQAPAGSYMGPPQGMRPVTGQPSQAAYYGMQRVMPDIFREQPVYNAVPQAPIQQQPPKLMAYSTEGIQVMQAQSKAMAAEAGYPQVMYDGSGRQVYYTAMPGSMAQPYQAAVDGRQGGSTGAANQEGKVVGRGAQSSSI